MTPHIHTHTHTHTHIYIYIYKLVSLNSKLTFSLYNLIKELWTILVNSSTNSNLKPRHLSGSWKGSYLNYTDKMCLYYLMNHD